MKLEMNCASKKCFVIGCAVLLFATWMAAQFWEVGSRGPAAIEQKDLFSFFKNQDSMKIALEQRILESIKIAKSQKSFQIDVRNFAVKSSTENLHLCEYFDSYTLTFEAEGIASSGERPSMSITAPCEISAKTKMPVPLMIPVEDIFKLAPNDTDVSFQINPKTNFSFRNVSDSWPEYWVLSKVEFNNKSLSVRDVIIDRRDIYKFSKNPITMSWE
jgi:hypothetical protein